ncbi:008dd07a-8d31-415c-b354-d115c11ff4c0 [Sclerotinia trifoliorum]|uniref:1,3-beta-glucanosyltransferase n=1 Tax=Sclerotinia trifoliorum TaxID=28548 RepID=A0A8H2W0K4_9HELO|nr:008dd07a-8d31-415c-b354-d115c11ff4c0 [Sclerotinia trifoliorum]
MLSSMIPTTILALCATVTLAVQTIEIQGSDFVNSATGNKFQLLGVAYQPGGSSGYNPGSGVDPLSDGAVCLRDAALMQQLGVNAIRVYNVDGTLNHDECASIFNEVGIYMLIDVNSPLVGESIDRSAPWTSYDVTYLNRIFAVVEAFKDYPNTLLFFAGNEVINDDDTGKTVPPYMRAVTRDLKNYIAKHSSRSIPVGYSAADVRDILLDTWNYLQCTTTEDDTDPSRVDLFALNSYSWCGDSSYTTSGYDGLVSDFGNSSVPVFFSEYGCNVPAPRVFTEVPVLYGPLMTPVLSGGMVYEFSQETSNYGLVTINDDGSAQLLSDYNTLQKQFNTLNITSIEGVKAQNTTTVAPKCDSSLLTSTTFNRNWTLPAVPPGAQDVIDNGIKNANNGKIISVSNTKVTQKVTDVGGNTISNLAIKPLSNDQSNTPSGETTGSDVTSSSASTSATKTSSSSSSTSTGTSSASSSTSTKKSGARKIEGSMIALVAMMGIGLVLV